MSRNSKVPEFTKQLVSYTELQAEWLKRNRIKNVDPAWIRNGGYKKAIDGQTHCKMSRNSTKDLNDWN